MTTCAHVACDRSTRARGLCEMHYGQLKRAGLPPAVRRQPRQASGLQLDCQLGRNTRCVDCGDLPFGGGMRCLTCFQHRVSVRLDDGDGARVWQASAVLDVLPGVPVQVWRMP
jgi:hypothetical protein